jgi:phage gp46-like protein
MTDIATRIIDFTRGADLALDGVLLANDDGLLTAVLISLGTDRQAHVDDILPNADQGDTDRRGWCGDDLNDDPADRIGWRGWLNDAAKQLPEVLLRDAEYAKEGLQWMIDDGTASRIDVNAFSPRDGIRALAIAIHRPNLPVTRFQFENFWGKSNGI